MSDKIRSDGGCLFIVGIPFLAIGIGALIWVISDMQEWSQIRG